MRSETEITSPSPSGAPPAVPSKREGRRRAPPPPRDLSAAARDLAAALAPRVSGEVRFDEGSRALYASDLSIYRQVPIGVVLPRTLDDVLETVAACRARAIPILGRGCGTSLAGQTCNVAVVLDFSKYLNRILELDPGRRVARVQPGVICDQLRDAAEEHHLTFAPDPATHEYATLGGMIGNNSCGVHTVMGGKTVDNVEALEVLTYEGTRMTVSATSAHELEAIERDGGRRGDIYRQLRELRDRYADEVRRKYPKIPRRVSGYNLDELLPERGFNVARALVGSESTCALVLGATLRLVPSPPYRALLVIGYPDAFVAADHIAAVRALGPVGLEAFQSHVLDNMRALGQAVVRHADLLPEGDTWVLAEFGGARQEEANANAREAERRVRAGERAARTRIFVDDPTQTAVWDLRKSCVGASHVPSHEETWPAWEDAAVAPEKLGGYLRALHELFSEFGYRYSLYGHWGDGCVHTRVGFDLKTVDGVRRFRAFMERAAEQVVSFGGSLSGEHGDGQARAELLPKMFGAELYQAFREFKSIWDPHSRMNPGKLVDPYKLDENLRLGPEYRPRPVKTFFQYPEDQGSFAKATERCFGVGKCRGLASGTMCPSFMATREEMHTTRGRARLLFEAMRGDALRDGWKDEHVHEALDLCLACKGCKGDCPVSVDVATYKAEFLAHYYEGRPRPRSAYAMGLVQDWARVASRVPRLANFATHAPGLDRVAKSLAGIAPERGLPRFARQSFVEWFRRRARPEATRGDGGRRTVLLWPDTFNNYFFPHTARAAVEVLESAGYEVVIPARPVCCGRPLYDYGMLARARQRLEDDLDAVRSQLRAGVPVVGLEPSCVSVFRDELTNLLPRDEDARRLKAQTFMLGEFLARERWTPPRLERSATVHGHCHHKSVLGHESDVQLLRQMGVEAEVLDSGCCGLAGSFGFEKGHYDLSMKIGERVLLPAVRRAPKDQLVISDGFSCREQIAQGTRRRALHLAEVLRMAMKEGPAGPAGEYPERGHTQPEGRARRGVVLAGAALAVLAMAGAALLARRRTRL